MGKWRNEEYIRQFSSTIQLQNNKKKVKNANWRRKWEKPEV